MAFWVVLPLLSLLGVDGFPPYLFLMFWPIMLGGVILRVFGEREQVAQEARSRYAMVAERERVARDVHDVLGHSLTALSVKAELAARLVDVDPARAKEELESIQATARQALAEVRATVGGLRAGNLEAELTAAPLRAGRRRHRPRTSSARSPTPTRATARCWPGCCASRSPTSYAMRARASVEIELGPHGIAVTDDGSGCAGAEGNGLRGMRERVAGAGGTLDISPGARRARACEVGLP